MTQSILITGGSGLLGTRLTELLTSRNYKVTHLGRKSKNGNVRSFTWDINKGVMDIRALAQVDMIIHLAGAGVADRRWTKKRKKEILESRTESTHLLYDSLAKNIHQVKMVISASAIGYYGIEDVDTTFTEESPAGQDYLAQVTREWEHESSLLASLAIRLVQIRIGVVLSNRGGALVKMADPVRLGVGAVLGNGSQWISWIHIDDLCRMFITALENEKWKGVYNGVAPGPVTNKDMTKLIATILNKPLWLPPVPSFMMRIILGEMAEIVLHGNKVSGEKAVREGFRFEHLNLTKTLTSLLGRDEPS